MRAVQNRPELKGMGTTVVAALFDNDRATLVHVGDSRAYLFRDGELRRLTDDHSWVQEQVNAGILSEDEAKSHPLKNVVTRALGGSPHVSVDLIEVPVHPRRPLPALLGRPHRHGRRRGDPRALPHGREPRPRP